MSQPRGHAYPISRYPNYVYRTDTTSPSYIYHAELGVHTGHLDFQRKEIEWVYTERAIALGQQTRIEAPAGNGHSTCTASKAAGRIFGASRSATLVVVKMPDYSELSIAEIFVTILKHIATNSREAKSVVTVSWGSRHPMSRPFPGGFSIVEEYIQLLTTWQLVPVVVAAGNAALRYSQGYSRYFIDTSPAVLSERLDRVLAIGNCDDYGARYEESQVSPRLAPQFGSQIYAPGVNVVCPAGTHTGTSFCELSQCLVPSSAFLL